MLKLNAKPEDVATVNLIIEKFREMFPGKPCYIDTRLNVADLAPGLFLGDITWEQLHQFETTMSPIYDIREHSDFPWNYVSATKDVYEDKSNLVDVSEGVC